MSAHFSLSEYFDRIPYSVLKCTVLVLMKLTEFFVNILIEGRAESSTW